MVTKQSNKPARFTNREKASCQERQELRLISFFKGKEIDIEHVDEFELIDALRPVASVISKCETGQRKHDPAVP